MARPSIPLTVERLREVLNYNPETGAFCWLKKTSIYHNKPLGIIGTLNKGYLVVCIDYRRYRLSRLAWLWVTGEWPNGIVDHIDRDKINNRWSNLRIATYAINNKNRGLQKNNTSGATGVCWHKGQQKWRAYIGRKHLGSFENKDEAIRIAALSRS